MTIETMTLPPELEAFVEAEVAAGTAQSASDVIQEALHLLKEERQSHKLSWQYARRHTGHNARLGGITRGLKTSDHTAWQRKPHQDRSALRLSRFFTP